jgi:hypothetical protein
MNLEFITGTACNLGHLVERLLISPLLSPKVSVSGHVYDVATRTGDHRCRRSVPLAVWDRYPRGFLRLPALVRPRCP